MHGDFEGDRNAIVVDSQRAAVKDPKPTKQPMRKSIQKGFLNNRPKPKPLAFECTAPDLNVTSQIWPVLMKEGVVGPTDSELFEDSSEKAFHDFLSKIAALSATAQPFHDPHFL